MGRWTPEPTLVVAGRGRSPPGARPGQSPAGTLFGNLGTGGSLGPTPVCFAALGQEPWTPVDLDLGILLIASFATRGRELFAMFGTLGGAVLERSVDDGATWQVARDA